MLKKRKWTSALSVLIPLLYILAGFALILLICRNGSYPDGASTLYHMYRGNAVYKAICDGDFWLSLDNLWYNGAQLLRYEAPLSAYMIAGSIALTGGNVLDGYLFYVFFLYLIGALIWFYIGIKTERPVVGSVLGAVWFLFPSNLYTVFIEGDLAFSLSLAFLPLLLYAVYKYLQSPRWTLLILVTTSFLLIILSSMTSAIITAVALLIFSIIHILINHKWRIAADVYLSLLASFLISGLWLLPSIIGANGAGVSKETLPRYFQDLWTSINPIDRLSDGNNKYYFCITLLALAVFGAFCAVKKAMAGFWTAIVIFLCSSSTMCAVISLMPGGEYLQMLKFFSIAACLILISFIFWSKLKKPIVIVALLLVCVDLVPSLSLIYGTMNGSEASARLDEQQNATLISNAKEITNQRLALMDLSSMDSAGGMLVSDWNGETGGAYGGNAKVASDYSNISQLDTAMQNGNFLYMFDRCMELGNDTVVVAISQIDTANRSIAQLDDTAARVGYDLLEFNDAYRLYHMDISGNWGTKAKYRAIGIGTAAPSISLLFPTMEETDSTNLNDYSFEKLSQYDMVYLAGFTYDDKESAEDLVVKLSESGVRVVIAADGIPQDSSHAQEFLDVACNEISFSNGYPELDTIDGILNTDLFPNEYSKWQTVYLEGLDEVWGTVLEDEDLKLDFYGTVKNDNIVMIGINLTYFYGLTEDPSVGELLSHAMNISSDELPEREVVPLNVEYSKNEIKISCEENDVNTSIVCQDIFSSEQELKSQNNLLYVQKGDTVIKLKYPYFWYGLLMSAAGLALVISLYIYVRKRLQKEASKQNQ